MNIVLLEPEIPQNTGNIVRTCAATGTRLHLIEPLGFDISEKAVRRAGLDYWKDCEIFVYKNIDEFFSKNNGNYYYSSTKAAHRYDEVKYLSDDYIFFGAETRGLPEELLHENYNKAIRIPMKNGCRSLNLSNSVAIVLYEALRQNDFNGLLDKGHLTKY
ncbi:MAG: tRNA (cytidine(34)-2'-O)-methyltransferase [Clostridia bacterium]